MFSPDVDIRIDWFRVLVQPKNKGFSLYAVADLTEIPKSTLNGYKQGSQPSYHHDVRLLRFWSQVTGQPQDAAPTVSLYSFKA